MLYQTFLSIGGVYLKEIKFFENYLIDENGMIYNKRRLNKPINQFVDNVGYKQCILFLNGKKFYKRVHRLVAETYISNPEKLPQVNHKDGNKLNNNVSNLEWVSNSQNTKHGYNNNLYLNKYRVSVNVYNKSGEFLEQFKSIRELSDKLKLNRKTVSRIIKGEKSNNANYIFEII